MGFPVWYFLGIFVRPGTDLGQDFSDMAYIFCIFYIAFYMLTYVCVVLLLHYVLVLFPLSGAGCCTVYWFIILIYTIVKLNVLLLLGISFDSIACASYFIHCVLLFDL